MRIFNEIQRFDQWWLQLVNLGLLLLALYAGYSWFLVSEPFGNVAENQRVAQAVVLVAILFGIAITYLFNVRTTIDEVGIHVRFFPFQRKHRTYAWTAIQDCKVRTYRPIREYGGWGYRISLRNGRAYNVKGNKGIQLLLKNNKRILIGTQKEKEAQAVIDRYTKNHERI